MMICCSSPTLLLRDTKVLLIKKWKGRLDMDYRKYQTVVQITEKWKISERRVRKLCQNKRIRGVKKIGGMYFIPRQVEKPVDLRNYRGLNISQKKKELLCKLDGYRDEFYKPIYQWDQDQFIQSDFSKLCYYEMVWGYSQKIRSNYIQKILRTKDGQEVYLELMNAEVLKYQASAKYVDEALKKKQLKKSFPILIKEVSSLLSSINEKNNNNYRFLTKDEKLNHISIQEVLKSKINVYEKSKDHPIEKALEFFLEVLLFWPFYGRNFSIATFIFSFLLMKSGYPAILEWEKVDKLWNSYRSTKNIWPMLECIVRLVRKRIRECRKNYEIRNW